MTYSDIPFSDGALRLIAFQAAAAYDKDPGSGNGLDFTSACFSNIFEQHTGIKGPLDGLIVRAILSGRPWVKEYADGYWSYLPHK